ncbi:hypothetical protein B0H13DRAFT_2349210 [Mycena leptocephala]|nr:hypothetical protein B0H13DRAFT_2349210 [Mycena leptocephala]
MPHISILPPSPPAAGAAWGGSGCGAASGSSWTFLGRLRFFVAVAAAVSSLLSETAIAAAWAFLETVAALGGRPDDMGGPQSFDFAFISALHVVRYIALSQLNVQQLTLNNKLVCGGLFTPSRPLLAHKGGPSTSPPFENYSPSVTITFLDSGASDHFFRDRTDLTTHEAVPVRTRKSALASEGDFAIVGKGCQTDELEAFARAHGARETVRALGYRDRIRVELVYAQLYLLNVVSAGGAEAARARAISATVPLDRFCELYALDAADAALLKSVGFRPGDQSVQDGINQSFRHQEHRVQVSGLEEKLEKWLQYPPDMKKKQDDTQELHHAGTGSWFLGSHQFNEWKDKSGLLWIKGNSGTSKSVLSSVAIKKLFNARQSSVQGTAGVAYFYFDFRDEKTQLVKIMLRPIILQLSAVFKSVFSS